MSQRIAREQLVSIAPTSSPGKNFVGDKPPQGALFLAWAVSRRMTLTRSYLTIDDTRSEASFDVSLETSSATVVMDAHLQGMYLVPVELGFDRFSCPRA